LEERLNFMARKPAKSTSKGSRGSAASKAKRTTGKTTPSKPVYRPKRPRTKGGKIASLNSLRAFINRHRTRARTRPLRPPRAISTGLSLDRKLDILGIGLALIGLLTLLSLLSLSHSTATGSILEFLGRATGRGAFLFPISLILLGLWLVLRNFERVPLLSIERLLGLILLYINLLVVLHFFNFPATRQAAFALAQDSRGGGFIGAAILDWMRANLGWGGSAVALVAWLLISLALALDVSVAELFGWISPLFVRLQDQWDELRNHRSAPPAAPPGQIAPPYKPPLPASIAQPSVSIGRPAGPDTSPFPASFNQAAQAWVLPDLGDILDQGGDVTYDDELDRQRAHVVEETLASFGAPVNVVEINRGPTITQFGVEPDFIESRQGRTRVRVGKIASLADDLALALAARRIRVEAPVPGKGYVGIEVPNENIALVALRDVLESPAFTRLKSPLRFGLGQDVAGNAVAADLAAMPHLLIAGATGSGKSVCVNTLICSLLLHNTPADLRMVMVDPKRVELTGYNGIPHLLAPVVVEMERVIGALQWVLREMDSRYHKLAQAGSRNILDYNARLQEGGQPKLPYLVVMIDELADLMMLAPDETERTITRLAQLARATGIHLVISTQRPSVDVVTGLIKANFPARVAFAVASGVDSRVILDQLGAERLLGRGDMLFQAPDAPAPMRLQGAFVSDAEIQRLVDYWRGFGQAAPAPGSVGGIVDALPSGVPLKQMPLWEEMQAQEQADPLLNESIDLVRRQGRASVSMLQRRLRIGYTRASRLIETMQDQGIIGTESTGQGFDILDYGPTAPPLEE
jgi:S-DNA-T family DNA segregation ATPase FtsK/SpoIIIE